MEIPVPFQRKLHKQWCLFDQTKNIDFDSEVKKIKSKAVDAEVFNPGYIDFDIVEFDKRDIGSQQNKIETKVEQQQEERIRLEEKAKKKRSHRKTNKRIVRKTSNVSYHR